MPREMTLVV